MVTSRKATKRDLRAVLACLFAVAAIVGGACGDDSGGAGTATPGAAPTNAAPTQPAGPPGTVTISSTAIAGQQGKMLLVFVAPKSGPPVARACIPITSNQFTAPTTVMLTPGSSQDPCAPGTVQAVIPKGDYTVSAGIYAPPANTPEKQWSQALAAPGDAPVTVTVDGAALSK